MSEEPPSLSVLERRASERESLKDTFNQRDNVNLPTAWLGRDSNLRIIAWNSNTSVVSIVLRGRILRQNGSIDNFEMVLAVTSDRAQNVLSIDQGIGWIQSLQAFASPFESQQGETFVRLDIFNNKEGLGEQQLFAGYITLGRIACYPPIVAETESQNQGAIRAIVGTNPAAGAEILETVPTNARWKILGFAFTFTASATVSNRLVSVVVDDGSNELDKFTSNFTHTANLARNYKLSPRGFQQSISTGDTLIIGRDEIILQAGMRIGTSTLALQAGDDYSAPVLWVEEWLQT